MYRKNAWEQYSGEERALLGAFADDYRSFLDSAKTASPWARAIGCTASG